MKRFLAFYGNAKDPKLESLELLNSFNSIADAMADMEIHHRNKYINDFNWEKESGFIFDLEENKYYKKEASIWRDHLEIPDSFQQIIKIFI